MSYVNPRAALQQYKSMNASGKIDAASPHRIIQMLLEGALEKIHLARGHLKQGKLGEKAQHITWAINIIDGLRMSLDKTAGGEIAQNLEDLYDYMVRRLVLANLHNDAAILDEITQLLLQIKGAWDAMPEQAKSIRPGENDKAMKGYANNR